jgi:hypothetical protein
MDFQMPGAELADAVGRELPPLAAASVASGGAADAPSASAAAADPDDDPEDDPEDDPDDDPEDDPDDDPEGDPDDDPATDDNDEEDEDIEVHLVVQDLDFEVSNPIKLKASALGDDVKLELMRQLDEKRIAYPDPEQWKLYHYGEHFKGKWPLSDLAAAYNPINLVICLAAAYSETDSDKVPDSEGTERHLDGFPSISNEELLKADCEIQEGELIAITDEWYQEYFKEHLEGFMVEGDWVGYKIMLDALLEELKEGGYYP